MQTQTQTSAAPVASIKRERPPRNGVDVPSFLATINAVRDMPELADFTFRASSRWVAGTHSQTRMGTFTGAGGDHDHGFDTVLDADHPTPLVGTDRGPTPVEFLLAGLAACLTAGIGNIASVRGVDLQSVEAHVEGDIDLLGILGLDDSVRNGYSAIRIRFDIQGDADEATLREICEQSKRRSAVWDVLTNGTAVEMDVVAS